MTVLALFARSKKKYIVNVWRNQTNHKGNHNLSYRTYLYHIYKEVL